MPTTESIPTFRLPASTADGVAMRRMRDDEIPLVGRLVRDAYAGDYELTEAYLDEIEAVGERAREHEVWVAADTVTGELLGTVTLPRPGRRMSAVARHEDELDFRFLGVAAAARGRGVGEAMVRHVLSLAVSRGIRRVVLNTGEQMRPARRLYERMGFERLEDREFTFSRPDGTPVHILAYGIDVPGASSGPGVATAPAA
ncbi:N-acetyltransferase [Agromyces luteolus]|uniref:GNAT family N-acetyltransferase n=1 Tax=Agromyces luteolus TaxID=88373 RepID=A0A7C9LYQ1_9MICO|nr:GNAT family N-acetyltransferase [Agromyces luteolus]MUN08919.1 GNAT family N-acetyltransferase [Agromyces luteolus]GLK28282.1 N-acetyltransferase [Agromyces luteolus]